MHEERRRRTAFVGEVLVEPERRAAGIGPGFAVAVGVFVVALLDVIKISASEHAALLAGAVVGEEQDQRVVESAALVEIVDQLADILVDAIDHRGVDRHLEIHLVLLFLVERIPCRDPWSRRR